MPARGHTEAGMAPHFRIDSSGAQNQRPELLSIESSTHGCNTIVSAYRVKPQRERRQPDTCSGESAAPKVADYDSVSRDTVHFLDDSCGRGRFEVMDQLRTTDEVDACSTERQRRGVSAHDRVEALPAHTGQVV